MDKLTFIDWFTYGLFALIFLGIVYTAFRLFRDVKNTITIAHKFPGRDGFDQTPEQYLADRKAGAKKLPPTVEQVADKLPDRLILTRPQRRRMEKLMKKDPKFKKFLPIIKANKDAGKAIQNKAD